MATTAAQTAANQANAAHSTGPRTEQGKARSARNSTTHGFRSKCVLLPGDDPAEYQALLDSLIEHFRPEDLTDDRCVREMADAEWRLGRAREYIQLTLTRKIEELRTPDVDPIELQALAFTAAKEELTPLLRHEHKFERQYDRAYRTWTRYQEIKRTAEFREAQELVRQEHEEQRASDDTIKAGLDDLLRSKTQNGTNEPNPPTPRNAACPCGSGAKFKRCCGTDAPPVLNTKAA